MCTVNYLYDGWRIIRETHKRYGSDVLCTNYYTWGLDRSGSTQGAGGVGGLLVVAVSESDDIGSSVFMPLYDANGNITSYLGTNGAFVAKFEYDVFGNTIESSSVDLILPFRFSTKYWDVESRLIYYGFRYFCSEIGRFLGRDPIQELGFRERIGPLLDESNILISGLRQVDCHNDLVNGADILGLAEIPKDDTVAGYVLCDNNCDMKVGGCNKEVNNVPVSCCKRHEEKHMSDIKRKGDWCTKDADGCCRGQNSAADSNSYEPQPPKPKSREGHNQVSIASECNAWEETYACCAEENNQKCKETAQTAIRDVFHCHSVGNLPYRKKFEEK